jgi:recombination protein RecT
MTTETRVTVAQERKAQADRIALELDGQTAALLETIGDVMSMKRFKRVSLAAVAGNPDLLACTPASVIGAILEAARLGLEPTGPYGGGHLVPYKGVATLIIDYRGLVKMTLRAGEVSDVETRIVYEGDFLELELGNESYVKHIPAVVSGADRGSYKLVYTMLRFRDASIPPHIDYMTMAEIDQVRDRTPGARRGPWVDWYDEMAKKTALRRALKVRATSPEVADVLEREDELGADDGVSGSSAPASSVRRSRLLAAVGVAPAADTPEPVVEPSPADLEAEKAPAAETVETERDPEVVVERELFADLEDDAP